MKKITEILRGLKVKSNIFKGAEIARPKIKGFKMKLAVLSVSLGSKSAIFQLWNAFWALNLELHQKCWIKRSFHSPWSLQKISFFDLNLVFLDEMALFWNKGDKIFYLMFILSLFLSFLGYEWLDSLNRSVTFGFQNAVCRFSTINSSRDTKRGYLGGG